MNKTVREWVNFLNMGINHRIALKMEGGAPNCDFDNYYLAEECEEKFFGWMDEIVVDCYINNWEEDDVHYHLLIYKAEEK